MEVDSYRFLPRSFRPLYEGHGAFPGEEAPVWTAFTKRLAESRIALLSSAGIYVRDRQPPFDVEREKANPDWGDPGWREIPAGARPEELAVAHLHINDADIRDDPNVALPMGVLRDLAEQGLIGGAAANHVSVMGFQDARLRDWHHTTAPAIASMLRDQDVDGLVLAPA